MKKLLLMFFAILAISASAEHFKFMGIPLDGDIKDFCQQLEGKGFVATHADDDTDYDLCYSGTFFGEEAIINIVAAPRTKVVHSVSAGFKKQREDIYDRADFVAEIEQIIEKKYNASKTSEDNIDYYMTKDGVGALSVAYNSPTIVLTYIDLFNLEQDINDKESDL